MEKGPSILEKEHRNFIENIIAEDLKSNKHGGQIVTRFPPEPNGYLHIGHAKAFCLNFGLARDNANARCHLRMDDTNPEKEDMEYVESIMNDLKWMGFDWKEHLYFASDYYEKLYDYAIELIKKGLAYIDSQTAEQIAKQRGNLTEAGVESPYRNRPIEESVKIFQEMREGKYQEGEHVLRAKIDMSSGNMNMRDPVLYRIRYAHHYRTENKWCIYPMYDYAHSLSDAEEGITHSLCSLEFQDHRPLYDWCVDNTSTKGKPRQIEFARLNLDYTVMSKRKLLQLVKEKHVEGWNDPRMPTISGVRRRGYPASAIRKFMEMIGVGKQDSVIELSVLEGCVRDELNSTTKRCLAVLDPIKVTITNWEGEDQVIEAPFHPQDESFGKRNIKFGKELYIERDDWMDNPPPPKKWFRLGPDRSVRLRYGYVITVQEAIRDSSGKVVELKCVYYPDSFAGAQPAALETKVKGIIHWVNANDCVDVEVRLYERLFKHANPGALDDFLSEINPESLKLIRAKVEPYLSKAQSEEKFQFERLGYFCVDSVYSKAGAPVFNKTVGLKESF
jgi:glutaminyl-tRNA synthetase